MPLKDIPQEIIDQCNLRNKVATDGCVHIEIRRAICGLRQSDKLANNQLKDNLAKHGCFPSKHTPGLFFHKTRPISFTLVVDNFGICHQRQEDADHLVNALKQCCPIKTDWSESHHCGVDLDWNHDNRTLKTSMKNCIKRALLQFQPPAPARQQHAPSPFTPPNCGSKNQMATVDNTEPMTPAEKQRLQQMTGKFLCLARSVDDTTMSDSTRRTVRKLKRDSTHSTRAKNKSCSREPAQMSFFDSHKCSNEETKHMKI